MSSRSNRQIVDVNSEDEVRLYVLSELKITKKIKVIGGTDGIWDNRLFEFKCNKRFKTGAKWSRHSYSALAQALCYCHKIQNGEVKGVFRLPHTIVICDRNGGFIVETKMFEELIEYECDNFSTPEEQVNALKSIFKEDWIRVYNFDANFWLHQPSNPSRYLINMLEKNNKLIDTEYFDFTNHDSLNRFTQKIKESKSESPKLSITKYNFIGIYDSWLTAFAPKKACRRKWADNFIVDLRGKVKLCEKTGIVKSKFTNWRVSTELYKHFWMYYKRPPHQTVNTFIATNKDMLYSVEDQNNNGDFYTPLNVVRLARQVVNKHISSTTSKTWWDPAAGGGNLFHKFNEKDHVILSTKFEQDVVGLKSNPTIGADLVHEIDFINDDLENSLLFRTKWNQINKIVSKNDELIFFLNPPFDDQAESRGSNVSLPSDFISPNDDVSPRSLRSMHSRFLYKILKISRIIDKKIYVAVFSKTAWVVGPDSRSFFETWKSSFSYRDGFLISSKVFNGVKGNWPCFFSLWEYQPDSSCENFSNLITNVYDKSCNFLGVKKLRPFDSNLVRLSSISKIKKENAIEYKKKMVEVVPVKNEYEVADKVYQDKLPENSLGYLRYVANDVYNSSRRVQITSSIFGPSNSNGTPILEENFEKSLAVYGIRKSIKKTWLHDKDEFYLPRKLNSKIRKLLKTAALYALIDGGYSASLEKLSYKNNIYSFRNEFFILSPLELANVSVNVKNIKSSYAVKWISQNLKNFNKFERETLKKAKHLILSTFQNNIRAKGDASRQLSRVDAGFRQIINGLIDNKNIKIIDSVQLAYNDYLNSKGELKKKIERDVYSCEILDQFLSIDEIEDISSIKYDDKGA